MAYKDLHNEPFDESTIAKLEIFEDYAQAWLPTFIMQETPTLCIFDFFSGTGYDKNGVAGSPIRILEKIKEQINYIYQKKTKIKVFLNEYEPKKFELLKKACDDYLNANDSLKNVVEINYYNEGFEDLFPKLLSQIKQFPSLVYFDQNGIKFLSDKYLFELEKISKTDFLYFVSASYFWRFGDSKEFKKHLNIDMEAAKKAPYQFIHRSIITELRKKLPKNTKLKLYPFSIKKGANIHGIIFGASHPRAVDKFLYISWKRNEVNGEANFDIDGDTQKNQLDIFEEKRLTKVEKFKDTVRSKILSREIKNNFELYEFVLEEGHIPSHASDCLRNMKRKGEVKYDGSSPLLTYDNVYRLKKKSLSK